MKAARRKELPPHVVCTFHDGQLNVYVKDGPDELQEWFDLPADVLMADVFQIVCEAIRGTVADRE